MIRLVLVVAAGALLLVTGVQAADYGMGSSKPMAKGEEMGAAQAAVVISAPADGAVVAANQPVKVSYQATTGPKGDHVHLYVDGERVAVLKQLAGDYELKMLSPGKHKINIEIVTKEHKHIGVGKEISVEAR